LAVVAVGILAVAGYFLFSGGSDAKPASGGSGGGASAPSAPATPAAEGPKEEEKPQPAAAAHVDPRNLLPRDSEFVVHIATGDLFKSSLGKVNNYLSSSLNQQTYEAKYGISPEDVERVVLATGQNWAFLVMRTTKALDADVLKKGLALKPAGQPIRGQEYFVFDFDPVELVKKLGFLT